MQSIFSDDSARVGAYDTFYGYGTVGMESWYAGTVSWYGGTVRWVRWVRYGGYGVPVPTVPPIRYPPYPTYRTLHSTIIFENRTLPQSIIYNL